MRSPIIAFSIVAAATVSPTLVSGAPTSPNLAPGAPNLGGISTPEAPPPVPHAKFARQLGAITADAAPNRPRTKHHARVDDSQTAGGNAFTGGSSDVNGGTIYNEAGSVDDTISNTGSSKLDCQPGCSGTILTLYS